MDVIVVEWKNYPKSDKDWVHKGLLTLVFFHIKKLSSSSFKLIGAEKVQERKDEDAEAEKFCLVIISTKDEAIYGSGYYMRKRMEKKIQDER